MCGETGKSDLLCNSDDRYFILVMEEDGAIRFNRCGQDSFLTLCWFNQQGETVHLHTVDNDIFVMEKRNSANGDFIQGNKPIETRTMNNFALRGGIGKAGSNKVFASGTFRDPSDNDIGMILRVDDVSLQLEDILFITVFDDNNYM